MAFAVTPGTTYTATSPVTSTNLNAHVSGLQITGITNTQIDTAAASLVQIISGDAGATATEGAPLWNKTTDKFGVHDGTTWVNHMQGEAMATLPRLLANYLWFDTTLGIQRIYITRNGLLGFHPIENGYLLVENSSGSNLAAGDVVVRDTSGVNHVKATTVVKDQTVVGVCLEAINNGASGIIATYGCPKNITVNIDETDGALAVADLIVSYSASNRGRTVGALATTAYASSTARRTGVPLGAFAVALSTVTANAATARMLAQPGEGARVEASATLLGTQSTEAGEFSERTITPVNAKHSPLVSAQVELDITVDAGAAGDNYDVGVTVHSSQAGASRNLIFAGKGGANGEAKHSVLLDIPTVDDTATPTTLGNKFATATTLNVGSTVGVATYWTGYTY